MGHINNINRLSMSSLRHLVRLVIESVEGDLMSTEGGIPEPMNPEGDLMSTPGGIPEPMNPEVTQEMMDMMHKHSPKEIKRMASVSRMTPSNARDNRGRLLPLRFRVAQRMVDMGLV
jgi:hypothetical protein